MSIIFGQVHDLFCTEKLPEKGLREKCMDMHFLQGLFVPERRKQTGRQFRHRLRDEKMHRHGNAPEWRLR